MAAIKPTAQIAEKWSRVTPQRTEDYRIGVQNPRRPWDEAAKAAASAYKEGVTKAANEGRFEKGVAKAGQTKWQQKAAGKGADRWGPGVAEGAPDYATGFAPFRDVIERTQLPQKFAKGDPRNLERVAVMAKALREAKLKSS